MSDSQGTEDFHRVNEIALVAVLRMNGHSPQKTEVVDGTVYWYFRVSGGIMKIIDEFADDRSQVEPKEYNKIFVRTKNEMFALLDSTRASA